MEELMRFAMEDAPRILEACLAVIGGLKVMARYTPWKWDDKLMDKAEKPVKWVAEKMPKRKK